MYAKYMCVIIPLACTGIVLSWISALLYFFSRFPQIIKNQQMKNMEDISIYLFIQSFLGNGECVCVCPYSCMYACVCVRGRSMMTEFTLPHAPL
jgi:uncharacterized protein with PQ loop repeat